MTCLASSKRDVVQEQVVNLLITGEQHPLWLTAFEKPYMQSKEKAAEFHVCYEVIQLKHHAWADVSAIDDFIRTAINAVASHMFFGAATIDDLCADGYSMQLYISNVSCAAMERFV